MDFFRPKQSLSNFLCYSAPRAFFKLLKQDSSQSDVVPPSESHQFTFQRLPFFAHTTLPESSGILISDGTHLRLCSAKHSAALVETESPSQSRVQYVVDANARDVLSTRRFHCFRATSFEEEAKFCFTASLGHSPEGLVDYAFLDVDTSLLDPNDAFVVNYDASFRDILRKSLAGELFVGGYAGGSARLCIAPAQFVGMSNPYDGVSYIYITFKCPAGMSGGALFDCTRQFYGTLVGACVDGDGDGLFMVFPVFQSTFPRDISIAQSLQPFWRYTKAIQLKESSSQANSPHQLDLYKAFIISRYHFDGDRRLNHVLTTDICDEAKSAMGKSYNQTTCRAAIRSLYGRKPETAYGESIGRGCRGWVRRSV